MNSLQSIVLSSLSNPAESRKKDSFYPDLFEKLRNKKGNYSWRLFNEKLKLLNYSHEDIGDIYPESYWDALKRQQNADVIEWNAPHPVMPRFILNPMDRAKERRCKKGFQAINLRQVCYSGENGFANCPDSFLPFIRFSKNIIDLNSWEQQRNDFAKIGLSHLAGLMNAKVQAVQDHAKEAWRGFQRMSPAMASIVLAKVHGMLWHDMLFVIIGQDKLPSKFFVDYETAANSKNTLEIQKRNVVVNKEKKLANWELFFFEYQPRLYPLHTFDQPEGIRQIINKVEDLQELNGAAFDYYWVVVPGFNLRHPLIHHGDGVIRLRLNDQIKEYTSQHDATKDLDHALIKEGVVVPCVLGERSGKCYFVSNW